MGNFQEPEWWEKDAQFCAGCLPRSFSFTCFDFICKWTFVSNTHVRSSRRKNAMVGVGWEASHNIDPDLLDTGPANKKWYFALCCLFPSMEVEQIHYVKDKCLRSVDVMLPCWIACRPNGCFHVGYPCSIGASIAP